MSTFCLEFLTLVSSDKNELQKQTDTIKNQIIEVVCVKVSDTNKEEWFESLVNVNFESLSNQIIELNTELNDTEIAPGIKKSMIKYSPKIITVFKELVLFLMKNSINDFKEVTFISHNAVLMKIIFEDCQILMSSKILNNTTNDTIDKNMDFFLKDYKINWICTKSMARSFKKWSKKNCKLENCLERISNSNNPQNKNQRLFEVAKSTIILYKYLIANNVQPVSMNTLNNIQSNNIKLTLNTFNQKIKITRKRKHSIIDSENFENQVNEFNSTMPADRENENNYNDLSQETTQEINYVSCFASEYCGNHSLDPIFLNENGFCKVCSDALQNYYTQLQNYQLYNSNPHLNDQKYQGQINQNYQENYQGHINQNYQGQINQNYQNDFFQNTMSNWIEKLVDTNAALTLLALSKSKNNSFSCKNGKKCSIKKLHK